MIDNRLMRLREVAERCDISVDTLKTWVKRDLFPLEEDIHDDRLADEMSEATGVRLVSWRTAILISIMVELVYNAGLPSGLASAAARRFTYSGSNHAYWVGDPNPIDRDKFRLPTEEFSSGTTWLIIDPSEDPPAVVVRTDQKGSTLDRVLRKKKEARAVTILNLSEFLPLARKRLGLPPRDKDYEFERELIIRAYERSQ